VAPDLLEGFVHAGPEAEGAGEDAEEHTGHREERLGAERMVEQESEQRAGDDRGGQEATEPDEIATSQARVPRLVSTGLWHRSNLTRRTRPQMRGSGAVVIVGGRPGRG